MWLFKTQEQKGSLRCALSPAVTGSRCTLVEKVLEHGKRAWSCYRAHLQHPVTLSKALLPNLVRFAPEQSLSIHSVCEQELTAQGQPEGGTPSYTVSWICHLLLSPAGVPFLYWKERVVDPLFRQLSLFHKLLWHASRCSCLFFGLFCPLLLLLFIQKLFYTFDHPCCPFLKLLQPLYTFLRKTRTARRIEGMSKSADLCSYMMMVTSFLPLSFLAVVNTCFSSACILMASTNSSHGAIYHNPELLLLREAISPLFIHEIRFVSPPASYLSTSNFICHFIAHST